MDVEGMVPDNWFFSLFFDLFECLSAIFAWEQSPIVSYSHIELNT